MFLNVNWNFLSPVRPGDAVNATVTMAEVGAHKPLTTLDCLITNQRGTTVLDGTPLVWSEQLASD